MSHHQEQPSANNRFLNNVIIICIVNKALLVVEESIEKKLGQIVLNNTINNLYMIEAFNESVTIVGKQLLPF